MNSEKSVIEDLLDEIKSVGYGPVYKDRDGLPDFNTAYRCLDVAKISNPNARLEFMWSEWNSNEEDRFVIYAN